MQSCKHFYLSWSFSQEATRGCAFPKWMSEGGDAGVRIQPRKVGWGGGWRRWKVLENSSVASQEQTAQMRLWEGGSQGNGSEGLCLSYIQRYFIRLWGTPGRISYKTITRESQSNWIWETIAMTVLVPPTMESGLHILAWLLELNNGCHPGTFQEFQ